MGTAVETRMTVTWVESVWWSWGAEAAAFSFFTVWLWCLGRLLVALDVDGKKVPWWIIGFMLANTDPKPI